MKNDINNNENSNSNSNYLYGLNFFKSSSYNYDSHISYRS